MDIEEGHVLPSFKLAGQLRKKGYIITYMSVLDNKELIEEQGYSFVPMFETIYPRGYKTKLKNDFRNSKPRSAVDKPHLKLLTQGFYDKLLSDNPADLFIISAFLKLDMLVLFYKYKITPVIFTPYLREADITIVSECLFELMNLPGEDALELIDFFSDVHINFKSLKQVVSPIASFQELIACPNELQIELSMEQTNINYIGPCIRDEETVGNYANIDDIKKNRQIIYVSMGSQTFSHSEECKSLFQKLINVMMLPEMSAFHLFLSVGRGFDKEQLYCPTVNVTISDWLPQLTIIKNSCLAIIHGGLGTVKECIYYGIPMIVFPLVREQPINAERIRFHKLGTVLKENNFNEADLLSSINFVLHDKEVAESVSVMQRKFRIREDNQLGINIIMSLIETPRGINGPVY